MSNREWEDRIEDRERDTFNGNIHFILAAIGSLAALAAYLCM